MWSVQINRSLVPSQLTDKNKVLKSNHDSTIMSAFVQLLKDMIDKHFVCAVCQSSVQYPIILECTHLFCRDCLENWMTTIRGKGQSKPCPICRRCIRENSGGLALTSFIRKVSSIHKFFSVSVNHHNQQHKLIGILKVLELPCKFNNIWTIYNMNPQYHIYLNPVKMKVQKSLACIDLIRSLRELEICQHSKKIHKASNKTVRVVNVIKEVYTMIFPWHEQLNMLMTIICDIFYQIIPTEIQHWFCIRRRHTDGRWHLKSPNCLCYCWLLATIVYCFLIYTKSTYLISHISKSFVKDLLKHVSFSFFDAPSYDMLVAVVDAFNIGIEVANT